MLLVSFETFKSKNRNYKHYKMLDNNKEDLSSKEMTGNTETESAKKEETKVEKSEVENEVKSSDVPDEKIESAVTEKIEEAKEDEKAKADDSEVKSTIKEEEVTTEEIDEVVSNKKEEESVVENEKKVESVVEKEKIEETKEDEKAKVDDSEVKSTIKEEEVTTEEIDEVVSNEKKEESVVENEKKEETVVEKEKLEVPVYDFSKFGLEEIVVAIQSLLEKYPIQDVKNQIENLKTDFNRKFKSFISEKKDEFIKEGGNEIDFKFTSVVKNKFNDLVFDFKKKRKQYYKELEIEQKDNLDTKLQLIDELKELIDSAEPSTMYKNFRVLQDKWRKVGQIPHTKYNDIWRTYHHHVERFYDLLHLNNDFRDLDFKHNLEEKTKLVEKAEELAENKDVNHAFKELQILHRLWKEDIGPVARDLREDIWERFSEATKKIHHKRHELQDKLDAKLEENIDIKLAIIDKIKAINIDSITSHKLWQDNIKSLEKLRDEFFSAGRVPKSKNEEIWQLFKDATKSFNKAKNQFYKSIKSDQIDNLKKKMQLVEQAESLKDSDEWDLTTEVYKKIQSEWKKIGHVPRRDSDKIWKRFKDACNHYFDRLHDRQDGVDKEKTETFNKKKDLLAQFKDQADKLETLTLDLVNEYIKDWRELGPVPMKMRHIESKFNKALESAYKKLNIDKDEAIFLKFKNTMDSYVEQNDSRKIDSEQLFIRRKIDEITKEIKQLENNISFISNASEDNPLIKNVYKNIKKYHKDVEIWKKKLNYIKQLDY